MTKMANSTVGYRSPVAASLFLQWLGRRSLPRSLDMYYGIHGLERVGCTHSTSIYINYYIYIVHKMYKLLDLAPPKQNFWVRQCVDTNLFRLGFT